MKNPFHHLARGILVNENSVLIAQASGYTNTFLPGGHIEFGESAKDALAREIEEELGIRCKVGKFLGLVEHKWERRSILQCEINQIFEVQCDEILDDQLKSNEPNLDFYWCHVDDLDTMNLQPYPLRRLIKNYLKGEREVSWESTLRSDVYESNRM